MTTKVATETTSNRVVGRIREQLSHAFEASMRFIPQGVAGLRQFAPYAAIELILPGGSLIALSLWYLQRKRTARDQRRDSIVAQQYSQA
jgi:hypothetical protein